jgi:hypothetical protein
MELNLTGLWLSSSERSRLVLPIEDAAPALGYRGADAGNAVSPRLLLPERLRHRQGGCASLADKGIQGLHWPSDLFCRRAPPCPSPKPQCLRRSVRGPAAQWISVFSTGLTAAADAAKVGGCANGLRIACGAGTLGGRCHHLLVTPIDWKRGLREADNAEADGHHLLVTPIDWKPLWCGLAMSKWSTKSPLAGDTY